MPVFTCSCLTDPAPLLDAMAGVERAVLVVKRDNVTAETMNNSFECIVSLLFQVLLIGFENAISGFLILNNYLIIMSRIINYLDLPVYVIARIMDFIINGFQNILWFDQPI